jgi:methionyl-tRNA formyltransferase
MSTHGGMIKGFFRHFALFGWSGTATMIFRVVRSKFRDWYTRPGANGPFFSLRSVAEVYKIPFYKIDKVSGMEFQALIDQFNPELLISLSCPQIVGKKIRDRFPTGCINVHGARLPRYRGLMPAFWVLRNGETATATTVHDLGEKLDNGDILIQREVSISPDDTWDSLVRKTKAAGAKALVAAVSAIKDGSVQRKPNLEEDAIYYSFPTARDREAFLLAGRRFF